jgi:hypothetical protein
MPWRVVSISWTRLACLVRRQTRPGGEALSEQRKSAHAFQQCGTRVEQGGDFRIVGGHAAQ